jgi:predicted acylesterase/phospholipase RssA
MIRHLVVSGGGLNFLAHLGIVQECIDRKVFDINNLMSCYAVSAGTVLGILFAMRIPITEITDYFIDRPWEKWMKIETSIFDMKCLFDSEMLRDAIRPFFSAYNVALDATFSQFFDRFGVDLHIYICDAKTLDSVDCCRHTHGAMSVLTAAIMSCSIPPLYKPNLYEGRHYIDGGFGNNFPVAACLETADPHEVLAIQNDYSHRSPDFEDVSVMSLMMHIAWQLTLKSNRSEENWAAARRCKYFISYPAENMLHPDLWQQFTLSPESRRDMIESGKTVAVAYFNEAERC